MKYFAMRISSVDSIDFITLKNVLTSVNITDAQKVQFIRTNRSEISKIMEQNITSEEFQSLMELRPLQKFKPIKNSFTKAGDKVLLAKTLGIKTSEVSKYIENVAESLKDIDKLGFLPEDKLETIKSYIYRHGNKDQIVSFLDYELTKAKDLSKTLYSTLEYHTGGIADYFIRPIHRMDNNTMIRLYNVVDKHIKSSEKAGYISFADSEKIGKWALIKIYQLQNNSKLINAIKTYKVLSQ